MTEGGGPGIWKGKGTRSSIGRRTLPHTIFAVFPHGPTRSPNGRSQEQCAYFCGCKQSPFINSQKPIGWIAFPGATKTDNTRGIRCVEGRYVVYSIPPSLPFPSHIVLEKYILRVTDLPDTTFYT
jgi:hypothetical protein